MKAIMTSRKPKECSNILNNIQKLIVTRNCPKDWKDYLSGKTKVKPEPIDVYLYCCYGEALSKGIRENILTPYGKLIINKPRILNGKVIAKFTLNKVEEIKYHFGYYDMGEWTENYILENACLSSKELDDYLKASKEYDEKKPSKVYGYAWHIDNLEIFDRPKELGEFRKYCDKRFGFFNRCLDCKAYTVDLDIEDYCAKRKLKLTKAPQNMCYIEVEE